MWPNSLELENVLLEYHEIPDCLLKTVSVNRILRD